MLVSVLLKAKGNKVFTVTPDDTLAAVAAMLHTRGVGAFVVTNRAGGLAGIISERDIIRALAVGGEGVMLKPASDYMTRDVIVAQPSERVEDLLNRMTDRRIRHLPVMDGGHLIGIVSIGDLVKARIAQTEHEAENLKAYITAG